MKKDPKFRDLLIGTGGLLLLTLIQFFRVRLAPCYRGFRDVLELLILWLVVIVVWAVYLIRLFHKRRKDKEKDPWNRKEKDPW